MKPQEILKSYVAKAKKLADIPEGFSTLTEYRQFRKNLSAIIIDCCYFGSNDSFHIGVTKENEEKLLKFLHISKKDTTLKTSVKSEVTYLSHCSKYGSYNPRSVLSVTRTRYFENIKIFVVLEREVLNHGSSIDIKQSRFYYKKERKYKNANIVEHCVKYQNVVYNFHNVISIGSVEYHYYPENTTENVGLKLSNKEAYETLTKKIAIRKEKAKKNKEERKKYGVILDKSRVENNFGWCYLGINDFCGSLGIKQDKMRTKELLSVWKNADKETKKVLKSKYRSEIIELLLYCRKK